MGRDLSWDVLFLPRKEDGLSGRKGWKDVKGSTYEAILFFCEMVLWEMLCMILELFW